MYYFLLIAHWSGYREEREMEEMFFISAILNVALGASVAICLVSKIGTRRCTDKQIEDVIKQYQKTLKEFDEDAVLYQHKKAPSLENQFQNYLDLLAETEDFTVN